MDTIQITSLEQVPAGLTLLFKEIAELREIVCKPATIKQTPGVDQLYTRKQTAQRLNITLATLSHYTKSKKIVSNRIGNRVLYKESDILNSLKQIKTGSRL